MKVAIMQPYIFPYLGYFQLVKAVDSFVFYDDVNFIKRGYINKNTFLLNGQPHDFTIPCEKISQNKLINETNVAYDSPAFNKLLKTFDVAYKDAPNFEDIRQLFSNVFNCKPPTIAALAAKSIKETCFYLGLNTEFQTSSQLHLDNRHLDKADRLIDITTNLQSQHYVNAIGGQKLYDKAYFAKLGVQLNFLQPHLKPYNQGIESFVPGLSILDALMWCNKEQVRSLVDDYQLV